MIPRYNSVGNRTKNLIDFTKKSMSNDNFKVFLNLFVELKLKEQKPNILKRLFRDILGK